MQLHLEVGCSWEDDLAFEQVLTSFDEQEKMAIAIGRKVRDWLRQVPVRRQGDRAHIYLNASWDESAPRAASKTKKARKSKETADDAG